MKFQFGTASLLLAVACSAIALGGGLAGWRAAVTESPRMTVGNLAQVLVLVSPWWIPLAFAAYCLGQGKLTAKATLAFAVIEAVGLGGMLWVLFS